MLLLPVVFGQFGNCVSGSKGTGSGACDLKSFGDPRGIVIFNKGFNHAVTADFDEDAYKAEVKNLRAFPLLEMYNFEQNTPENDNNTSSTGVITEIRNGKPQFSFMYDKGGCFHKALYDKKGKNRWDLAIVFDEGVLMASSVDDTKLLGFDMGMFSVDTFKLVQGTDPQMSKASIQLLDALQFNLQHEFLTWEYLGFNMNRVGGVIEGVASYGTTPVTGTSVRVKLSGACNSSEVIAGLDDAAKWRIGGVQATATAITAVVFNASTGEYEFTLDNALVAADTVQFELYDGNGGFPVVEDALGAIYKAIAPIATIA